MNVNLTLYEIPVLTNEKNFVLDNIDLFLTTYSNSSLAITSFQFQRFELSLKIKVNLSQINSLNFKGAKKYNYIKFVSTNSDTNKSCSYYYFVLHTKQIGQGTIEYELKMDVLNTFKFVSSMTYESDSFNYEYTLSDKTLVKREHKDRLQKGNPIKKYFRGSPMSIIRQVENNVEYNIDVSSLMVDPENAKTYIWGLQFSYYIKVIDVNEVETTMHFKTRCTIYYTPSDPDGLTLHISGIDYALGFERIYKFDPADIVSITIKFPDLSKLSIRDNLVKFLTYYNVYRLINKMYRVVDSFPEGLETMLFKNNSTELLDGDEYHTWYVSYMSSLAVVDSSTDTQPIYVNPVQIDFIKDTGYVIEGTTAHEVTIYPEEIPQYNNRREYLVIDLRTIPASSYIDVAGYRFTGPYVYDGETYNYLIFEKVNNTDLQFAYVLLDKTTITGTTKIEVGTNIRSATFYGIEECALWVSIVAHTPAEYKENFYIGSGDTSSLTTKTSPAIDSYNLTDSKLIKIINFPYCPREDFVGKDNMTGFSDDLTWNSSFNALELKNARQNGFNRNIMFEDVNPLEELSSESSSLTPISQKQSRIKMAESKLFHSDFYYAKFVYDSFSFVFRLENVNLSYFKANIDGQPFIVKYVCSANVNSKFMFQFTQYVCSFEEQDYNDVLVIERNNEIALYNNAYINYIRNGGFTHDTKNADMQKLTNGLTLALTTIGAVVSFASTPATHGVGVASGIGLLTATATKTINAIESAQQNDRNIAQKMLSASQQGTSVSTSEDVDILKAYSNNKAKLCEYKVKPAMENALWDLFYYFGYKCQDYKIPNVTTRSNFNFVQADITFDKMTFNDDIANEIKNKWNQGITFFHKHPNESSWDITQQYENWEVSLLEE